MNKTNFKKEYLNFLTTPITHDNGDRKPRVKSSQRWLNIEDHSKNELFLNIELEIINGRKVWIWSDQHFYHENVIKYSERPYKNVEEMNQELIDNYNEVVEEDDICIFAGDVTFKSTTLFLTDIMPKLLKGYKILVVGNHDFDKKKVRALGFDETRLILHFKNNEKDIIISHYPFFIDNVEFTNVHGHIHTYKSELKHQINVSIEAIDFRPVLLKELI